MSLRAGVFELLQRALRRMPAGHLRADHEQHAVGQVRDDAGVGHRHHRRRIDDHPLERAASATPRIP